MTRRPDWRARLEAVLRDAHGRPFDYGRWDCALFTAACVEAMTGTDLARGLRGYRSRAEGLRMVRAKGMTDHVAVFAAALPEIAPAMVRPGDVAVLAGNTLGIVQGRLVYVAAPDGTGLVARDGMVRGFQV